MHHACPPRLAVAAALAGLLASLTSGPARAADAPPADQAAWLAARWAGTDLAAIAAAARKWRDEKGSWPADCNDAARAYLQAAPKTDPWGSAYACSFDGGKALAVSVGPDGRRGTADDITPDIVAGSTSGPALPAAPEASPLPPAPLPPAAPEAAATAESLRRIAAGLESFRKKTGHYPVTDKIEHLERWLVSEHLAAAAWTTADGWGRPLRYRTTDVGSSYSLASAGDDGRWEAVEPGAAGAAPDAGADLVLVDGAFRRWPLGLDPTGAPAAEPAATAHAPANAEPQDPAEKTRHRINALGAFFAQHRRDGRFIESDDAERLAGDLGARTPAVDGWGRPLSYLSASGGAHFALVSAGPDGRMGAGMEAYARGASAVGDDIVAQDGAPLN